MPRACPAAAAIVPAHHVWRSRRPAVGRQGPEPIWPVPAMWAVRRTRRASCGIGAEMHGGDAGCRALALATHDRSERAVHAESRQRWQQRGDAAEGAVERSIRRQPPDAHRIIAIVFARLLARAGLFKIASGD